MNERRAVNAMAKRWANDLDRLESLFGPYTSEDFSFGAEMQRNLETALAYAEKFLATKEVRP